MQVFDFDDGVLTWKQTLVSPLGSTSFGIRWPEILQVGTAIASPNDTFFYELSNGAWSLTQTVPGPDTAGSMTGVDFRSGAGKAVISYEDRVEEYAYQGAGAAGHDPRCPRVPPIFGGDVKYLADDRLIVASRFESECYVYRDDAMNGWTQIQTVLVQIVMTTMATETRSWSSHPGSWLSSAYQAQSQGYVGVFMDHGQLLEYKQTPGPGCARRVWSVADDGWQWSYHRGWPAFDIQPEGFAAERCGSSPLAWSSTSVPAMEGASTALVATRTPVPRSPAVPTLPGQVLPSLARVAPACLPTTSRFQPQTCPRVSSVCSLPAAPQVRRSSGMAYSARRGPTSASRFVPRLPRDDERGADRVGRRVLPG